MSDAVFEHYSAFYDLLYRDKDYAAEADYVTRRLRPVDTPVRQILEFGSGTGRHGRLLAQRAFEVTGIERSKHMVTAAEKAASPKALGDGGSFESIVGDLGSTHLQRTFDAVIALFHVISYQTSNEDVLRAFENAARHLEVGGVFLFDVWHGPAVLTERPAVRIKRMKDERTELIRIAEPTLDVGTNTVDVHYTILSRAKGDAGFGHLEEHHRIRYFFPLEIDLLASQTGFVVEWSEEFLTGSPATDRTWGVAYLLRKVG